MLFACWTNWFEWLTIWLNEWVFILMMLRPTSIYSLPRQAFAFSIKSSARCMTCTSFILILFAKIFFRLFLLASFYWLLEVNPFSNIEQGFLFFSETKIGIEDNKKVVKSNSLRQNLSICLDQGLSEWQKRNFDSYLFRLSLLSGPTTSSLLSIW